MRADQQIYLACDGRGPATGLRGHGRQPQRLHPAETVIGRIRIHRPGPGRPRLRPERVVADKGYSARSFRACLRRRGIKATIPECVDQLAGRRRRRERPCGFDRAVYRRRNVVEGCVHRLKQWRGSHPPRQTARPLPRHHPGQHTHTVRHLIGKTLPSAAAGGAG
ncbi:transposase [Streptomyces bangladeshensis]|uniref:transposase n=1 Tax=Streptomyces bangladeshensis TaxID=295352 RepID=UPI003D158FBC